MGEEVDAATLDDLYTWVDQVDLSRPKKDIKRDFSDGVLVAEVVAHFCPKIIERHNYSSANKIQNKLENWGLLNRKVFKKLDFQLKDSVMKDIVNCKPWAIENFLLLLRRKIDCYVYDTEGYRPELTSEYPEADQQHAPDSHNVQATSSTIAVGPTRSLKSLHKQTVGALSEVSLSHGKRDMVPRIRVEEVQQEILAKEETVQILTAKVRRLEHLLQLKDIRIDDLSGRLERAEIKLKPTSRKSLKK